MVIVPGLVMLGYGAADAIGASLFADTVASLVVSWTYYQAGNVNLRQGWWIAVGSILGAQVGSYISPHIAESSLGGSFFSHNHGCYIRSARLGYGYSCKWAADGGKARAQ